MKANEYFKKYGTYSAKRLVETAPLDKRETPNIKHEKGNAYWAKSSIDICVDVQELKRLIESHELVDKCGGLIPCKKILVARTRHKSNAEYFMVHPEKPNFIQLYRRNEAKLIPNYRFRDLEQAIADVESCQ